ncbi:hypothetical protein U1Q18_044804 [Sarracenia purpurea var. burkii]
MIPARNSRHCNTVSLANPIALSRLRAKSVWKALYYRCSNMRSRSWCTLEDVASFKVKISRSQLHITTQQIGLWNIKSRKSAMNPPLPVQVHFEDSEEGQVRASLSYKLSMAAEAGELGPNQGLICVEASKHAHYGRYNPLSLNLPLSCIHDNETFELDTDHFSNARDVQDCLIRRILIRFGYIEPDPVVLAPEEEAAERLHLHFVQDHPCICRGAIEFKLRSMIPALHSLAYDSRVQIRVSQHKSCSGYRPQSNEMPMSRLIRVEMFEVTPDVMKYADSDLERHLMQEIFIGAVPGTGQSVTKAFAQAGRPVAIISRTLTKLQAQADEINALVKQNDRVKPFAADATDEAAVKKAFAEIQEAFKPASIHNSVGGFIFAKAFIEAIQSNKDWDSESGVPFHSDAHAKVAHFLQNHKATVKQAATFSYACSGQDQLAASFGRVMISLVPSGSVTSARS